MNETSPIYRRKQLKPSSIARLERWVLALRLAQIERTDKRVLDSSDVQAHIRRRFESEWCRDGAPADALIAIRTMLGVESVEYRLARVELRMFFMNEEARAWRGTLLSAWKEDYVPLSAVVWWIATSGAPRDCDDGDLESAAKTLLRRVRSKDAPLAVWGRQKSNSSREEIPRNGLADAMPFFGIDEHKFISGVPCVHWNSMLEDSRDDVIEDKCGARTWCDLSIEREDMLRLWPAPQDEGAVPAGDAMSAGIYTTLITNKQASRKKRRLSPKADPIAKALKRLYPDGRPPLSNPDLQHALMKECIIDKFVAKNTMSDAVKLAWPDSGNQ